MAREPYSNSIKRWCMNMSVVSVAFLACAHGLEEILVGLIIVAGGLCAVESIVYRKCYQEQPKRERSNDSGRVHLGVVIPSLLIGISFMAYSPSNQLVSKLEARSMSKTLALLRA